jgi:hypothetical protein
MRADSILAATKYNDIERVEQLIKQGFSVNTTARDKAKTPLLLACENYNFSMVKLLLENGANTQDHDKRGRTAIDYVLNRYKQSDCYRFDSKESLNTCMKMLHLLLAYDAPLKENHKTHGLIQAVFVSAGYVNPICALHSATYILTQHLPNIKPSIINRYRRLQDVHRTISFKDRISQFVLNALGVEGTPCAGYLDFTKRDRYGFTPLHWAAARGHAKQAELLLCYGASFRARNYDGLTPLSLAIRNGHNYLKPVFYNYIVTKSPEFMLRKAFKQTVDRAPEELIQYIMSFLPYAQ